MAVDNPSYFSLQGAATTATGGSATPPPSASSSSRGFSGFFRRGTSKPVTTAGTNSSGKMGARRDERTVASPRSPATGSQRRSFRNLFRSASASADCEKTRQFLKGEPRPSDVAPPSPYLNSRSHVHSETSRLKANRRGGPKSPTELLSMDMVFCGLAGEGNGAPTRRTEDNDYYSFERDTSVCDSDAATLPIDDEDARSYYNLTATLPSSLGGPTYSSMGRRRQQHQQPSQRQLNQQQGQRRRRRHSIGTFLERERCALAAAAAVAASSRAGTADLVVEPDVVDYADECARRFGTRHAPATAFASKPYAESTAAATRDDVVFISSKDNEASTLWVNYLSACFEQISRQQGRPPFRVTQVTFEEPLTPGTDQRVRSSRLQIVVVCPVLLERVAERPEHAASLTRQLNAERVLAMMLGVQDGHLGANHRTSLHAYASWRKFFVKDQDETFVGQFLGAAVAILGSATTGNMKIDKTGFSVHPKKVKMGASRILALLNEPLHPDDAVTVTVDRCGEALEVGHVKRRNPYTLQFSIPERCLDVSMLVGVRIARNGAPLGSRQVKCESRLRELDQILRAHDNPLEFMCQTFGFNSGDKEQLDNWMVHAFQKNIPPHFNLLSNPPGDLQLSRNHSSSEENPTLLHFAARFGLEKLAWQLLECPGGDVACDMRNTNDMTPADLAEQAGHVRLAHQLRGYMQMNEFSNMYSYLKVMSENANGSANGYRTPSDRPFASPEDDSSRQEDYCRPRPLSEAYSVPPTARPVTMTCRTFPDYSTPPPLPQPNPVQLPPQPASTSSTSDSNGTMTPTQQSLAAYSSNSTLNASSLDLPLQGLRSPDSADCTSTAAGLSSSQLTIPQSPGADTPSAENKAIGDCLGSTDQLSNSGAGSNSKTCSLSRSSQASNKSRESPQDELLEIINDFKNNVFTISEVERLVANWRNRNDVQQSFKDKQRQLSAMRDEYERIQKRMKEEMRAPTPFDRIRKFFTKGKKDSKDLANTNEDAGTSKQNGAAGNLADRRPVSSLSLHSVSSSSSSGRMSTVSGCSGTSLGDSGTHSDTEDRRLQHPASEDKSAGMTSYEIPPAPKPFHGRLFNHPHHHQHHHLQQQSRYTPTPGGGPPRLVGLCPSASNSELDLRAVKSSVSIADDKEYYIAFPPSGLPIHSFKSNGSLKEPKTPSTPVEPHEFPSCNNISHNNDISETKFTDQQLINNNYANLGPILNPPPGMCIPFQYVNITAAIPKPPSSNVLTIQPDIHAVESTLLKSDEPTNNNIININETDDTNEKANENENDGQKSPAAPDSPKILNTDVQLQTQQQLQPDYTNVQVAASEEIARNFGVTLKKLPGPPVPPRCEFNFAGSSSSEVAAAKTVEG